jgi:hypothetical protein
MTPLAQDAFTDQIETLPPLGVVAHLLMFSQDGLDRMASRPGDHTLIVLAAEPSAGRVREQRGGRRLLYIPELFTGFDLAWMEQQLRP